MKILFAAFLAFISLYGHAEDKSCEIESAVRCMCPASMRVTCAGVGGYIKNDEKVKSAVVIVSMENGKKKNITLNETQLSKITARSLYGINYNDELKKQLGLSEKDQIDVNQFAVDSQVNLYSDTEAKNPIAAGSNGGQFGANYANETYKGCQMASDYEVFKLDEEAIKKCRCTNKIPVICHAKILCDGTNNLGFGENTMACPQINGKCPSLKDCIDDTEVDSGEFNKDKDSKYIKTNSSNTNK
jgi:hypothetical protein